MVQQLAEVAAPTKKNYITKFLTISTYNNGTPMLTRKIHIPHLFIRTCSALVFGIIFVGTLFFLPEIYFSVLLAVILCWILVMEWGQFHTLTLFIALTPVYPILPFVLLMYLNQHNHDLLYYLFSMVFAYDTCAYITGNVWGRHKIAPTISPGKTWQGLVGGYCGTLLAACIVTRWHGNPISGTGIVFAALVCCVAFAGDLFESWLKRKAGLKDAGTIMPGHGGLLDRFDSIMFVAILFFLLRNQLVSLLLP